jgi:hypothetical protein
MELFGEFEIYLINIFLLIIKMTRYLSDEDEHSEEEEEEEDKEPVGKYDVICQPTNKQDLYQPPCVDLGILPELPFGMAIIGKSGSGKTQMMIHMMTSPHLLEGVFDFTYLFTGIKADEEMIKALNLPKDCIKNNFEEEDVKKITDKLEKTVEKQGFKNTPSVCMIFDDFLNKPKFMKSDTMVKLATGNRHMNISYILLSQYYKKLTPVIRTNVAYIAFFPASLSEVIKLSEEQCPANTSHKDMIKLVQHATAKPYQFLGINSRCSCDKRLRRGFENILKLND